MPRWQAADVRRYAWWSVLSGAFGHTYGENSVIQMYVPGRYEPAYVAERRWDEVLQSPGANQMRYLKEFMLSRRFERHRPDPDMIIDNGHGYDRIPVLRGPDYAVAYTHTGRTFSVRLGKIRGERLAASWYSPRDGETVFIETLANTGEATFDPPGDAVPGNDWVLFLQANGNTE